VTNTVVNTIEIPLGLFDFSSSDGINLYPNPSNGKISISSKDFEINKIQIYNLLGELMFEDNALGTPSQVDLSHLSNGMYVVKIMDSESNSKVRSLVIRK
jgi:hypothetical protein